MQKKLDSSVGYISFLFLPMLSLILAIKNYRLPWAKNVVWAFTAFYAYHFSAPNKGADINAYIGKFYKYSGENFAIPDFIKSMYAEGSTTLDIIEPLISYLTSQVTNDHKVLLLIYGLIYGFFFSRNIWFFIDRTKGKLSLISLSVLSLLVIEIGVWHLNGFRFWCATHIYIYAVLHLLIQKNSKAYLLLILSGLMHLGMLFPILLLIVFRLIKFPFQLLFIFYFMTFFLVELDLSVVRSVINNYAPSFVMGKLNTYTSEAYVEVVSERLEGYSFFYKISKIARSGLVIFFVFILYINNKLLQKDLMYKLFLFYLLLGGIANILSQIPSGGRYIILSDFILYGTFFYFIQSYSRLKLSQYVWFVIPIVLVYAFYNFRIIGIHSFNIHHFISNPIVSLFIY